MPCKRADEVGQQVRRPWLRLLRLRHQLLLRFLLAAEHLPPLVRVEGVADAADVEGLPGQELLALQALVRPLLERRPRAWAWEEAGELPRQRHQPRDCSDRLSW